MVQSETQAERLDCPIQSQNSEFPAHREYRLFSRWAVRLCLRRRGRITVTVESQSLKGQEAGVALRLTMAGSLDVSPIAAVRSTACTAFAVDRTPVALPGRLH